MTTAHRPTWAPAKGHEEQGGSRAFGPSKQYSSRDLASHTTLKLRRDNNDGIRKDDQSHLEKMRAELLQRESDAMRKRMAAKSGGDVDEIELKKAEVRQRNLMIAAEEKLIPDANDRDFEEDSEEDGGGGPSSSDDSDDEDDTAALLAELEKIKKERAAKAAEEAQRAKEREEKEFEEKAVGGNPLLDVQISNSNDEGSSAAFGLKRRWDDDVVFRNQTRDEPKHVKRFINDTIRNDFHRRFLNKYIL